MCGIAGIYNLSGKPKAESEKLVRQMADSIAHRGPDDEGFFVDANIALGHRRLSILDLSEAGHQPMFSPDKNLVIVFNGEIYNYVELRDELRKLGHKFKTRTDTEVILASYKEWGVNCLKRFNGMWAFVIYDRRSKRLFGSRDRFGVKPFYYYWDKGLFVFASEIKAILVHPEVKTAPNNQAIRNYLVSGLIDYSKETCFENIFDLRGGQYFVLDKNQLSIKKYWELAESENKSAGDQACEQDFADLFKDAVKLRLRSDVPIGTCLSGGLDSSAIVCQVNELLVENGKIDQVGLKQRTFSACYDRKKFAQIDEKIFIDEVVKKTKVKPSYIYPKPADLVREIKKVIWHHDLPLLTSSAYAQWNVFKLARQHKVKVMLDGQGSDEVLAGYLTFFPVYFASLWRERKFWRLIKELRDFFHLHYRQAFIKQLRQFFKFPLIKSLQKGIRPSLKDIYMGSYFDASLFNQTWYKKFVSAKKRISSNSLKSHTINLLAGKGLSTLLRYEDRNSMAFSIESRTPFLDYRLVKYAFSLPDDQKIRNGETKWIMRRALGKILPKMILNRHDKIGFETPEEFWLKHDLAPLMKEIFSSKEFRERPYFNAFKVIEAFDKFIAGEPINYQLFWRIFNLELWLRQYFKS